MEGVFKLFWQDRRDLEGSSVELVRRIGRVEIPVAEVFCRDQDSELFLTLHEKGVPVAEIERLISGARGRSGGA